MMTENNRLHSSIMLIVLKRQLLFLYILILVVLTFLALDAVILAMDRDYLPGLLRLFLGFKLSKDYAGYFLDSIIDFENMLLCLLVILVPFIFIITKRFLTTGKYLKISKFKN